MQEIDPTPSDQNTTPNDLPTPPPTIEVPQLPPPVEPAYTPTNYTGSTQVSVPTNALAIVSLIASILSWLGLFGIGGIVGLVTGVMARNEIKRSSGTQSGDGLALTGIVLGAVNVAFTCLALVCGVIFFGLAISSGR